MRLLVVVNADIKTYLVIKAKSSIDSRRIVGRNGRLLIGLCRKIGINLKGYGQLSLAIMLPG